MKSYTLILKFITPWAQILATNTHPHITVHHSSSFTLHSVKLSSIWSFFRDQRQQSAFKYNAFKIYICI